MTDMFDIHTDLFFGTAKFQVNTRVVVNGTGFARRFTIWRLGHSFVRSSQGGRPLAGTLYGVNRTRFAGM
jgi:hypothetical protein